MFFHKLNNTARITLGILFLTVLFSCHRYYMPVTFNSANKTESANFIASKKTLKYFILHDGERTYALNNIGVDNSNLTMSGKLSAVDPSHLLYINAKGRNYKYKEENNVVLSEVHIYLNKGAALDTAGPVVIPLNQVSKIEVIEYDKKRTTSSYVLGGIGIGVGAFVVTGLIVALTKESCPFISVYDGEQFQLQGELFGGAVNRQLERMDYVPLKALPVNGEFQVRISNELKEKQYTNFADLLVIEHPENVQVLPDAAGKLYQVANPVKPISAMMNKSIDVLQQITRVDGEVCSFNDTTNTTGINELNIRFRNNGSDKQAKLVLHLKNSYWLDYLYGEFTRNFGGKYESWRQKQQRKPAEPMIKWTEDQHIPLCIAIETNSGWKEIKKLKTIGPLANRSVIIPIELEENADKPINIKLSTGFMFWEVDYAAIDFTVDQQLTVTRLHPAYAEEGNGNSVLSELAKDDDHYLSQPEAGSYAILKYNFKQQPKPGNTFSLVFHTKGYYEPIREYSGKPDIALLKKFRQPGYLAKFSLNRFQKIHREQPILAINND